MSSNRLQAVQKADEAHKQNIQKSVEHRLEVAKAKGDEKLVRQLEAEQAYYS
ncbi:hypothetical protein A0J48_009850 [Sphaerospermopsis aphanizomenoides BCCUSP55]|uniref:arginine synthesis PII-interacting regulator PirA n=1 Tax=Sphaerospermopsis aphanizomenoides TaxID=459663 RepID=UPI000A44A82C|nr:hypothetical protein [Sphaerospermopsis aphanizomenoides]MBK1987838.1 hypothetical protein [Sphaerospermopsis aphanizomenoides BCCUSP55]